MSDIHANTDKFNKYKELVVSTCEEAISDNVWVIGVSKTHPGLKYYFNTVTGVSLWNISKEDMDRAKNTMKSNGNQPHFINCPEPKDPPPSKKASTNLPFQTCSEHVSRQSKSYNKQLLNNAAKETAGTACDLNNTTVNSPPNVITVNFRPCSHHTCVPPLDNTFSTVLQSQNQHQSSTVLLDVSTLENNHCSKGLNQLLGSKRSLNRSIADIMVKDPCNEHLHNLGHTDNEYINHNTSHFETLNMTSLRMFAENGVNRDKWYIIADSYVYLHHITLLKSVVNSDKLCCLMVPQNVKIELENATKTELRTKAYCASYYIYKMFDDGLAHIDGGSSKLIENKSNEEYIIDCCLKLKEQNFYVVVISNDVNLQQFRNKMHIPIFTVEQLKEYLSKSNYSITTTSPEPTFKASSSTMLLDIHDKIITNSDVAVKRNKNIESPMVNNDVTRVQGFNNVSKITADAEVQTNLYPTQLEKNKKTNKNDVITKMKENTIPIGTSQSSESSIHGTIHGTGKRIKLRRNRICDPTATNSSTEHVNSSERHMHTSNIGVSTSINNLVLRKKLEEEKNKIKCLNENPKATKPIMVNILNKKIEENTTVPNLSLKSDQGTILHLKEQNQNNDNKNVMFEVTTEVMEQSLRRKCDEWVSRFVQIMEEALTQVLRKNSSLYLPPPWNMYEAAICIEKRFSNDEDIVDASKKFLSILKRICDVKGNIYANISPTQYMEMYSFGVYMIDALQGIFSSCEDLQTAAESLSKLLNDIQDPESDMTNIERSLCVSQEEYFTNDIEISNDNVEVLMIIESESNSDEMPYEDSEYPPNLIDIESNKNNVSNNNSERSKSRSQYKIPFTNTEFSSDCIPNEDKSHNNCQAVNINCSDKSQEDNDVNCIETTNVCDTTTVISPSRYNLRSRRSRMSSEKQDHNSSPKENRVIQSDIMKNKFLSNFLLQRNRFEEDPHNREDSFGKSITPMNISKDMQFSRNYNTNDECSYKFNGDASDTTDKANIGPNKPKIIRNFVTCSEFEDRLRARRLYGEIDELDYEDDPMAIDTLDDKESSDDARRLDIDEFAEFHDNVDVAQHTEREVTKKSEDVNIDFKSFVRRLAQEITELSIEIYSFSQKSCEALNSFSTSDDKRHGIRQKAEEVHLCIDKLCTALTNILNRDKNGGYNVQALLKHTEFGNISIDNDQIELYRSFVARCLDQAHDLKNIINDVLSAVY